MLINQLERQHKAQAVASSNESSLKTLHHAALDSDSFADDEFAVRFDSIAARTGAKKINLAVPQRNRLPAVADDSQHSRGLKNPYTLSEVDSHKQICREERNCELDPLTILPTPNGLIGRKKCFNVTDAELLESRLFVLGGGIDRVPISLSRGANHCGTKGQAILWYRGDPLQIHLQPLASLDQIAKANEGIVKLTQSAGFENVWTLA